MIGVTHIIAGLAPDGAERMLHRLVSGMDPNRFENEVISLTDLGPMSAKMEAAGVRVRALGMKRGSANPYHLIRLAAWLRKLPPQQVIQTWMYHADLIGGIAAKLAGCAGVVWNIRHSELHPGVDKRHTILTAKACAKLSRWLPRRIICASDASQTFSREARLRLRSHGSHSQTDLILNLLQTRYRTPCCEFVASWESQHRHR